MNNLVKKLFKIAGVCGLAGILLFTGVWAVTGKAGTSLNFNGYEVHILDFVNNHMLFGVGKEDFEENDANKTHYEFSDINGFEFDIDCGDVDIIGSQTDHVKVTLQLPHQFKSDVYDEKGLLHITVKANQHIGFNYEPAKIIIEVPNDHWYENANIHLALGDLNIESLSLKNPLISCDLGSVELEDMDSDGGVFKLACGDFDFEGTVASIVEVHNSLGEVHMNIHDAENIGLDLSASLGEIRINDETVASGSNQYRRDTDYENKIIASVDLGSLTIEYNK